MDTLFGRLSEDLSAGRRVFLALVVGNSRHSPGTAGAALVVNEAREVFGTVGGGVMERDLVERGRRILTMGVLAPEVETLHHRRESQGKASGMICAGHQTNLYAVLGAEDRPWVDEVVARRAADAAGWLCVTPAGFAVVEGEAFDAAYGDHVVEHDRRTGDFLYRRQLLATRRLAIFGGGHCALALARVMARLGYRVEACESTQKAPECGLERHVATLHRVEDFRQAAGCLRWPELTWAVVMTSDFPSDVAALLGALGQPFPFLGLMGSPAKLAEIRRRVLAAGFGEEELGRLVAPVGLAIGSHTPEEIAISIAAQILQRRQS